MKFGGKKDLLPHVWTIAYQFALPVILTFTYRRYFNCVFLHHSLKECNCSLSLHHCHQKYVPARNVWEALDLLFDMLDQKLLCRSSENNLVSLVRIGGYFPILTHLLAAVVSPNSLMWLTHLKSSARKRHFDHFNRKNKDNQKTWQRNLSWNCKYKARENIKVRISEKSREKQSKFMWKAFTNVNFKVTKKAF